MRLLRALLAAVALMVVVAAPAQAASTARAVYPVTVLSSGRITFSGDSGGVPITVENTSKSPVTVTIEWVGYPKSRLDSDPLQGVIVDPGAVRTRMRAAAFPGEDPNTLPHPDELAPMFVELAGAEGLGLPKTNVVFREWLAGRQG